MKKFQLLLPLIIFSKFFFAQTIPTFCLSLNLNSPRNLCGTATYDGNYVAAGIVGIGGNQDNFVAKCDGEGNILWSHQVGTGFTDDLFGIMETSDHAIVVVGFANGKMCMVKYDHDGNEIWKKDIVVQEFDFLYDLIETSDGNYLLSGVAETFFPAYYYCAVIKVTPDGDLLWNKNFYGTYHGEIGYSIIETADHRYVIGGYSIYFSDQFFLLSMDTAGTVQWVKKTVLGGVVYDLVATSDSAVVAAGYTCSTSGCDATLTKIDANGDLDWAYTYGDTLFDRFYAIAALPDGSFAMAGDATDQLYVYHGFVVKCDSNGQMQWGKITNDIEFRSIGNSPDGGIMVSSTGGGGFGIMKFDTAGNSCPGCPSSDYGAQNTGTTFTDWTLSEFTAAAIITNSTMTETSLTPSATVNCTEVGIEESGNEHLSLQVFPNPSSSGIFEINIPKEISNAAFEIHDITGKLLMTGKLASGINFIDLSNHASGVYFLFVEFLNQQYAVKLVR